MADTKISDSVIYIGADDHDIDLFESQYVVPNGVSYNSYVIIDEKIAVMDTADPRVTDVWFDNLEKALGGRKPDYLVVQHMEPDHAGNIKKLAEKYPEMKELWDQYHDKDLPKKLWDNEEFWSYEDKPQATRNLSGELLNKINKVVPNLFGGSAGREGAALQMGGSIGSSIGRVFRFDEKDKHVMIMCGMSAAFSALFGTPMAAAIFSMEMISVGVMYYIALVPCVISSLIAHGIASYFNVTNEFFAIENIPDFTILNSVKISALAILCALVSILFCVALHSGEALYKKYLPNKYTRVFIGGCFVIIATMLVGNQTYNGTGMSVIQSSIDGSVRPEAFLLKIIFTALTLGAGFKGGEIVPSFFIGATFGCLFGNLTGFEPSLCTAVGMISLFCGVTNCPITSLLISFELFGYDGMPYFLLAIPFSYMLSGYFGLYRSQKIVYSKYKTSYINKSTH